MIGSADPSVAIPGLAGGFLASLERVPSRPALVVGERTLSYAELGDVVARLAAAIDRSDAPGNALVAVLAHRSVTAYAGVLAALASGRGYVPLNPRFPPERIRRTLGLSGTTLLVAGAEALPRLEALLDATSTPLAVFLPDEPGPAGVAGRHPGHRFVPVPRHQDAALPSRAEVAPEAVAYLLFTSGSTGEPKGVPVSHANIAAYVRAVCSRYPGDEQDRFSQMSDLTFDWSVHDLFPCWERGASLYCVPESSVFAPAKFIRDHRLTFWSSVPSVVSCLLRMRMLRPGAFPSVRFSTFCGEPLSVGQAEAWQGAARDSVVENLYGPTEATVALTAYRWDAERSPGECVNGIVPIGRPFPGQRCRLVAEDGAEVERGEVGELCLGGSQVTSGYWNDAAQTARRFGTFPDTGGMRWYRTGDLAREDERGCLHFVGRIDSQVKIRGYRVELQEIDHVVRRAAGTEQVVTLPWPVADGTAAGVVAFVAGAPAAVEPEILAACRASLPEYMVPRRVEFLEELPLNANGKVDRGRLATALAEERK